MSARHATRTSDFTRFWLASAVSNLGDGIRLAALPLLAVTLTDDARLIAGTTAFSYLPWVLFGPLAGAIVDRHDRRQLMLLGQLGRGLAIAVLAAAVATDRASIALLYLTALVVSIGETLVDSASQAAIPQLVDDGRLEVANGRMNVAENLFNDVLGVAVGAVLFAGAASAPFAVDALTFLGGALLLATVRRPLQGSRTAMGSYRTEIREGFCFLRHNRVLRGLAASVALTNVALHMGLAVLVVLVVHDLGASESTYGAVVAIGATGGVLGSFVAGGLARRLTASRLLMVVHAPFVVAAVMIAVAPAWWVVSLGFGLSSFALVVYQVPSRALRQRVTPDRLLGRVVSTFRIFGLGGPVIGAPIGGVVAQALGVRWAFAASASVMLVAWARTIAAVAGSSSDDAASASARCAPTAVVASDLSR
jgi:MFS family permease